MGHKVHPKLYRIGIIYDWSSKWFENRKKYIKNLREDFLVKEFLMNKLRNSFIDRVEIERSPDKMDIIIYSARPGMIIGRNGVGSEKLKKEIKSKFLKNYKVNAFNLTINEVNKPNLSARIVSQQIVDDIEKRVPYRRAMKSAISRVKKAGALGVKVKVKGRLNGAEIARPETLAIGKLPLHTLRANIDYALNIAHTTYGAIGVKVWIYKGEVFKKEEKTGEVV